MFKAFGGSSSVNNSINRVWVVMRKVLSEQVSKNIDCVVLNCLKRWIVSSFVAYMLLAWIRVFFYFKVRLSVISSGYGRQLAVFYIVSGMSWIQQICSCVFYKYDFAAF